MIPFLVVMIWGLIFALIGSKLFTLTPVELVGRLKTGSILFIHEKVYIGWLIGGIFGIKIFRKILGFNFDLFDLFAFALPVGFALMRIGCLLGGCCFGKPANLPWALVYAQNSPCYNHHRCSGMLPADAESSLPVHPAQVYEIIAMIIIISLLLYLRNHLKKPGSLGYSYLLLHSILRFFIDFTKEGGTYLFGLKSMQWFLLFVIPIGTVFILLRERNFRTKDFNIFEPRPFLFNFILYLPAPLFLILPKGWLTPAEFKVLLIASLIVAGAFVYRGLSYVGNRFRLFIRIPVTVAGIAILESSTDTTITKDTLKDFFYLEFDGGYMNGAYREICGGLVPYEAGGVGAGLYFKDKLNTTYGINIKGYAFEEDYSRLKYGSAGAFTFNHRYVGFNLGAGMVFPNADYNEVYPSIGLRLGPRDWGYIEGEFLKHKPADLPSPIIKLGIGIGTKDSLKNETHVRLGVALFEGYYANPVIYLFDNRLIISPYISGGMENDVYQFNLTIGYRYYFKD